MNMRPQLQKFHVREIAFGQKTAFDNKQGGVARE
jgi:hypothetical protein